MNRIETTVFVDDAHRATIELPADISPGTHRVVLIIDESAEGHRPWKGFPVHHVSWPKELSLRRADLYGDDGR